MDECSIKSVAAEHGIAGGPFGSDLVGKDYRHIGVPVIRGQNMSSRFIGGEYVFVTPEKADTLSRNLAEPGDLIFTQRGTLGQCSIVPQGMYDRYVISQSQMRLRVDAIAFDFRFVYYAAQDHRFLRQINDNAISTGVPHINLGILSRLKIPNRPLWEQQAIAEVLGALDDKIAANLQVVQLTDQLLSAVFQRESEGSSTTALSMIAEVNSVTTKPIPDGRLRYLDISSVGVGAYEFPGVINWSDAPGRARRGLRHGDTVWSTVRPNRRSHALVLDDDPELVASTGLAVLTPNKNRVAGVYEATRTPDFSSYLESVAEGSAYPAVRSERFLEAPIPDLTADSWEKFEALAMPMRERAHAARVETRALANARDELLPLLMSGKLRVKDAEKKVEAIT